MQRFKQSLISRLVEMLALAAVSTSRKRQLASDSCSAGQTKVKIPQQKDYVLQCRNRSSGDLKSDQAERCDHLV